MLRSYKVYLKNPFSLWVKWFLSKIFVELRFCGDSLSIGYLSSIVNTKFGRYNTIGENCSIRNCELGSYTYIANQVNLNEVRIGKFSSIGSHVMVGLGKHPARRFVSTHPVFYSTLKQSQVTFTTTNKFDEFAEVVIGNDVWIGARTIVMDGVQIGNGAIIGAGAVVTKNVPPYAIVAGVPASLIRYRFSREQIDLLESFQWWNMDEGTIRVIADKFDNIDVLCEYILQSRSR